MKKKIFTPFRFAALLFAGSFLMCANVRAQSIEIALTTEDVAFVPGTTTDLSGSYAIKTASEEYLTTDAGCESLFSSTNGDVKYVINFEKTETGTYLIKAGDLKANHTSGWNIVFDNTSTENLEWIITLTGANTVTIQKNADSHIKLEFARGRNRFYSDAGLDKETTFTLEKVLTKETVNRPAASTYITETATLADGADLSGKYVIYNATGGYMTANTSDRTAEYYSLLSSVNPEYAFNLTKQDDGSYTISNGDFQLVSPDNAGQALVSFEYKPTSSNTWTIGVVDATTVTIQSKDNVDKFLKNELNGDLFKYVSNGASTDNVNYTLLKVPSTATSAVSEQSKSTIFESGNKLVVTNTSTIKSIAIYTIYGQKVYRASVNSNELSIPVSDWNKGVYLVKLTDGNGESKSIKTSVK